MSQRNIARGKPLRPGAGADPHGCAAAGLDPTRCRPVSDRPAIGLPTQSDPGSLLRACAEPPPRLTQSRTIGEAIVDRSIAGLALGDAGQFDRGAVGEPHDEREAAAHGLHRPA